MCQWKNLLQNSSNLLFWGWIYYRTIQSYNLGRWTYYRSVHPWTRRQTYQRISLVLLAWLIMNYLFMTQSHHDVISLDIVMFFYLEINTFAHANVAVLVILRRASKCSCLDRLFWMLHYLYKNILLLYIPYVSLFNHL
jgi:hypothetical protein